MALATGTRLGPYEIVSALGAGGMGEVYRARDTRLNREVALKVIPDAFASDAERMTRFQREAQLLASLNHPHIAALYGLEESQGTRALVMELVEGQTLAERIAAGPIPMEEAAAIARQIAEALESAHERGIVHRDLKPANIKLLPDGEVKVLDFGLAKALESETQPGSILSSPTLTAAATKMGVIIGTAAYMSPEQAKGKAVDRRSDIWSFGCVFYEMLAGKLAFPGETITDTLAAVVRGEPDWSALPAPTPVHVRRLIERCLRKEVKQRLQAIGEARIALEETPDDAGEAAPQAPAAVAAAPSRRMRELLPWAVAAALAISALLLWHPWRAAPASPVVKLTADVGIPGNLYLAYGSSLLLSPDGRRIVYVVEDGNRVRHLWMRSLDQLNAQELTGTEGARDPFFSPDGKWIGFFADNLLKKVSREDGAVVTLCTISDDRGGAWGEDGSILFAPATRTSLMRISAGGGTPAPFSKLQGNDVTHRWPQFLPGGKAVIFTSSDDGNNYENADIVAQVIATGERKTLYHGGYGPRYLSGGYLAFVHQGTLFGMRFDAVKLQVTGQPVPIIGGVVSGFGNGGTQVTFANTGTAVYLAGDASTLELFDVAWLTEGGKPTPLIKDPKTYWGLAFSPDGNLLALAVEAGGSQDILVEDWKRNVTTRLTFGSPTNVFPAWTPDGKRLTFGVDEPGGKFSISWKRADGSGDKQILMQGDQRINAMSWRPDGKVLMFTQISRREADADLYWAPLEGSDGTGWKLGTPQLFAGGAGLQSEPAFSPDGKWVAYQTNETGRWEIFVRSFPGPGGRWQVSQGGGLYPSWSAKKHELFFVTDNNQLMAAPYSASGDSFVPGTPKLWNSMSLAERGPANINYALHPDGVRAAVVENYSPTGTREPLRPTFVFNFLSEVKQKLAGTVSQ